MTISISTLVSLMLACFAIGVSVANLIWLSGRK